MFELCDTIAILGMWGHDIGNSCGPYSESIGTGMIYGSYQMGKGLVMWSVCEVRPREGLRVCSGMSTYRVQERGYCLLETTIVYRRGLNSYLLFCTMFLIWPWYQAPETDLKMILILVVI